MRALPPEEVQAIAHFFRREKVAAGQRIFAQGDPGDALHLIDEGQVRVILNGNVELAKLGPGEAFGEVLIAGSGIALIVGAVLLAPFSMLVIAIYGFVTGNPIYSIPITMGTTLLVLLLFPLFYVLLQYLEEDHTLSNLDAAAMTGIYVLPLYFLFTAPPA